MRRPASNKPAIDSREGFTLIEILTVLVIVGILAALLIPAVQIAVRRAKTAAMRAEVNGMSQAIDAYQAKYGDYPPDFSDWALVQRHYRKVFPNIRGTEITLLGTLTSNGRTMDPSEALVWALGGFSSNPELPFSGTGGPLTSISDGSNNYPSFNTERENSLFDFELTRMDISQNALGVVTTSDGDIFPSYIPSVPNAQPYVYFDARTYLQLVDTTGDGDFDDFNGYFSGAGTELRGVRPYSSNEPVTGGGTAFANRKTFQVLGPGLDGFYGTHYKVLNGSTLIGYYFQYPTGALMTVTQNLSALATAPTVAVVDDGNGNASNGYLESSYGPPGVIDNFHLDNVTSFSSGALEDDLE